MPEGHPDDIQAHPHAGGWGALQAGPLRHPNLPEEPGQHGAEDQEEDLHSPLKRVSERGATFRGNISSGCTVRAASQEVDV